MKPKRLINDILTLSVVLALWFIPTVCPAQTGGTTSPSPSPAGEKKTEGNGIRLNFRGVPLDTVLDYLSEAAGFIIVKETDLDGRVDVWSHQPLTQDEAIDLLNTVLHEKGYAAVRNGRTLTIVTQDEAKLQDLPVRTGNNPEVIPKKDEMITQIVPVRYTDAMKLVDNLQPLIPSYATLSANESSNAIVITDTQTNIRRIVEIIRALDTSISGISALMVFPLQYSDATELAEVITQLFQTDDSNANQRGGRMPPFFGGRGGRGRGNEEEAGSSEARKAASRVVAVADERSNSLVVSAPEELMPSIKRIIEEVDLPTEDITEIRVFKLQYADATELAQVITDLFPDESTSNQSRFAPRFGGFFGRFGGNRGGSRNNQQQSSERQLQQTTVRCVADPRTDSIVVTAAHDTMLQITEMVKELDKDPTKRQQVFVYRLEYADVDNVAEILRNIFENQLTNTNRQTSTDANANTLRNRTVTQPESLQNSGFGQ